ncbi:MurR/RpiR family transcriptional regulator [Acidimangrovimonas sediminis]|uniref:MurR/RpiR family transcriptional regulator n=1 Tax=Acidimangrovimonas sediminis TaxID=2056283 RepID=UPI000C802350|nr:MurR/RpiR family transcriptional regulator [Acidimangrovimonas sediminis]
MSDSTSPQTLRDRVAEVMEHLTASERKIAGVLLSDYPYGGLMTIQELGQKCGVSAPSITRFIAKLGCSGYQDFQRQLIGELKQRELSPVQLKYTEAPASDAPFLSEYTQRLVEQMGVMAESISPVQFDAVCALIADPSRNIFILGGRVTDSIALLLSIHLRQIRNRIYHLPSSPELWPEYVLRMRKQDVVILFDLRRYQKNLASLAEVVVAKPQASVVAITDKWLSPIAASASHVFAVPIELKTAWDTQVCLVALIEAIIVRVSESNWDATRKRIESWDDIRFRLTGGSTEGPKDDT